MILTCLSKCKKCNTGLKINTTGNMSEGRIPEIREPDIVAVWCPNCMDAKRISSIEFVVQSDLFYE